MNQSPEYPLLSSFLNYLRFEINRAPLTAEAYERDILQFALWLNPEGDSNLDFTTVTSSDVRAWLASIARGGDTPRTVRRKIQSLRAFYRWMTKTGMISSSPLKDISLPKIPKPLPDLIKPEEIEFAIGNPSDETSENPSDVLKSLIPDILYSLGIRRAELIALNDSDISYSAGEIKVTGKRSKQRIVPTPQKLLNRIKSWQNLRDREWPELESPKPLLVIKGKRISPQQVYNIVHSSLALSSGRKKSPHALRHSFASAMLNGGADIDSVREFLGHTSLATTQIYTHISFAEIKKAYSSAHPRIKNNPDQKDVE